MTDETQPIIGQRFRGFLPVVVDVETAGFNSQTDALLEIAAIPIIYNEAGQFVPGEAYHAHINPFQGANLDRRSLDFIGIARQTIKVSTEVAGKAFQALNFAHLVKSLSI